MMTTTEPIRDLERLEEVALAAYEDRAVREEGAAALSRADDAERFVRMLWETLGYVPYATLTAPELRLRPSLVLGLDWDEERAFLAARYVCLRCGGQITWDHIGGRADLGRVLSLPEAALCGTCAAHEHPALVAPSPAPATADPAESHLLSAFLAWHAWAHEQEAA